MQLEDSQVQIDESEDLGGGMRRDTMTINMGPQHPSTHGVLRLILTLDGETIIKAEPDIGYLHTGIEKTAESKSYFKALVVTDRMDYLAPLCNNLGYSLAVEKLLGIEAPERALYARVILAELQRIASHLVWLGTSALLPRSSTKLSKAWINRSCRPVSKRAQIGSGAVSKQIPKLLNRKWLRLLDVSVPKSVKPSTT